MKCVYCGKEIPRHRKKKKQKVMTCSKPCSNAYNWLPVAERHRRKIKYGWKK